MLLQIAGLIIQICPIYERTALMLKDYTIDSDNLVPDIIIKHDFEDIVAEQQATLQRSALGLSSSEISFFNKEKYEFYAIHRKLANEIPQHGVFLMHGAVVSTNGLAYMFTAPSGVGKTTRAKLWLREYPSSNIINGDKPFIKITNSEVIACGTPWSGKEKLNTNCMVPLKAIFLLERSDKDMIIRIGFGEAFDFLFKQTYMPPQGKSLHNTILLLNELINRVDIYRFYSTKTSYSVHLAYETANLK